MKWKLFFLFSFLSFQAAWAQREIEALDNPSVWDRIYFGGGGTVNFGQNYFVIGASPLVGYMISPRLSAGLGATYLYTRYGGVYNYNSHTYGGRTFARYNLLKSVYAMAEYEMLSFDNYRSTTSDEPRFWVDRLLFGGGYYQSLGPRGGFNIGILYDVLYRPGVAYRSPWVTRIGFTF